MLDAPDRVESERLDHLGEPKFLPINLGVRKGVVGILKYRAISNVHDSFPPESPTIRF
jgi:hypothetical protein